jgi:rhomboid protease GluP
MCPNCRAFITSDDKVCPYCDLRLGERAVDRRSPSAVSGIIPAARFTTVLILLINGGLFAATAIYSSRVTGQAGFDIDGQTLLLFGAKSREFIQAGQWWRLLTAGFLHGGIVHILMNSWVIFDLGTAVEETFGTARYLVIYFVSTIAGFQASSWFSASISVGASAPLFGLLGAMIAASMFTRTGSAQAMRSHYTQWAIWGLVIGFLPGLRIDNAAHIGGLAAGFALAWVTGTRKLVATPADKLWKVAAVFCVIVTLAAFALMLQFLIAVQSRL